jgi:HEXXH motif-containing protein
MTLGRHFLPKEVFLDLAMGGGGVGAAEHLHDGQCSKRLLLLRGVRDLAEEKGHEGADRARRAYELLAEIQAGAPEATAAVLHYPTVGSWALRTLQALSGQTSPDPSADPSGMAAVAAAAAIRSGRNETIEVPVLSGAVVLPSLGRASVPGETGFAVVRSAVNGAEVTTAAHRVTVSADPHSDGPGWEGLRHIRAEHRGIRVGFVIDDLDPNRMPGAKRIDQRLTEAELHQWASMLQPAWEILVERHPVVAEEVSTVITVLTPLVAPQDGTSSATSKLAFGNVGISTPPDPHSFAVTLAHEAQHAKLSALIDLVPLTEPDDGSRYYAPWRDDPRPLGGLLQGAYAHRGIAAFWRVERAERHPEELALRAHTEFALWRDGTEAAIRTLRGSDRLTVEGEIFAAKLAGSMVAMCEEQVPAEAQRSAQSAAEGHLAGWRRRNGEPPAGQIPFRLGAGY